MGFDVTIKSHDELKTVREEIKLALSAQVGQYGKFPLIYKYPGDDETTKPEKGEIIGTITNIRITKKNDIICTVNLNPMIEKSKHFTGTIDNILVGLMHEGGLPGRIVPTLISGIVYDKFAKSIIDEHGKEDNNHVVQHNSSPSEGRIGVETGSNPLMDDPKIMGTLFENRLAEELRGGDE